MRLSIAIVLALSIAGCDTVDTAGEVPGDEIPVEPPPAVPPPPSAPTAAVPTSVVANTTLVDCPVQSTTDVWHSAVVGLDESRVLVFESYQCRSARIHEFDASGALVRTDSTDIPRYLRPGTGGFYFYEPAPPQTPTTLSWFSLNGDYRAIATFPTGTPVVALEDGSFLAASDLWSRIGADGSVLWSGPRPAAAKWQTFAPAADGGLVAAGCAGDDPYCSGPGSARMAARLGPDGTTAWTASIPWDGVSGWTFEAIRPLPDGGAVAVGGASRWLYGRTPDDPALSVVRFGPDGAIAWERRVAGWERLGELVQVTDARLAGSYLVVKARHFSPATSSQGRRHASLVLSADDGTVVGRSPLGPPFNGSLVDLGDGRWARAAHGGTSACPTGQCSGNKTLEFQILR